MYYIVALYVFLLFDSHTCNVPKSKHNKHTINAWAYLPMSFDVPLMSLNIRLRALQSGAQCGDVAFGSGQPWPVAGDNGLHSANGSAIFFNQLVLGI
jgi:hypothetical protein